MISDKVYEIFGKELPDRSTFRARAPSLFREVIKTYKSWGKFVLSYSPKIVEVETIVVPAPEIKKREVKKQTVRS